MNNTIIHALAAIVLLGTSINAQEVLEPINIISANKTEQSISETTSNIAVITSEEIEEKGYQSVAEALSRVAGVSFTQSGGMGTQTSLFMRGMKTEKILVLLDGVSLNNPSSTDGQAFFEHISLDTIEQIEVIKGGASSIWGADASAGVINIITKKAKEGLHGNLGLTYGSYNTKKMTSSFSYKSEKLDWLVSSSKIDTKGFSAVLPKDAEADGYANHSTLLKLGYDIDDNHRVVLNYNYIDAKSEYDGQFSLLGANDPVANIDTKQKDLSLTYLYTRPHYRSELKFVRSDSKRLDTSDSSFGDALVQYNAEQKVVSWVNSYQRDDTNIVVGIESKKTKGVYQFNTSASTQNTFKDRALFLSVNQRLDGLIDENTVVEGSIRKDFFDTFDNKVSYKVGLKHFHQAIEGLTSSINYYRSTDTPNSYQMANVLLGKTLKPDTTQGYDVTLQYKNTSITYFSNVIEDKLGYFLAPWPQPSGYVNNQGKEKAKGIEISTSYTFDTIDVIASANYTHLLEYEDEGGLNLDKRAKDQLNLNVDRYLEDDTYYGVSVQFIGDRVEFGKNTGNYALWNLNYSTKIAESIKLNINVKNIFDKEYESVFGYATQGRSAYAKITYTF